MAFPASVSEAISFIRLKVNDVRTPSFYSDAELTSYIEEASLATSYFARCVQANETITSGSSLFNPVSTLSNIVKIEAVLVGNDALKEVELHMLGHVGNIFGNPKYYISRNDTVGLYPIKTGTSAVVYASISTSVYTEIPAEFRPALLDYAIYLALLKDRRVDEASAYKQSFIDALGLNPDNEPIKEESDYRVKD